MAEQYKDPWADAANQAVGALYKYYLSKPTAVDALDAQTKQQQMEKIQLDNRMNQRLYDMGGWSGAPSSVQENLYTNNLGLGSDAAKRFEDVYVTKPSWQDFGDKKSLMGVNGPMQTVGVGAPPRYDIKDGQSLPVPAIRSSNSSLVDAMMPYLVQQESGGNPNALSPKGAAGKFQIMPDTARDPGFNVQPLQGWDGVDPRTAPPQEQERFARDYLAAMERESGGDPRLTAAMYNAGPGAVKQAGGIPQNGETPQYVENVAGPVVQGQIPTSVDPNNMPVVQYPISPADQKKQGERMRQQGIQGDLVNDEMNRALNMVNEQGGAVAGFVGNATSGIPGLPSHDLSKMLDTIKAVIGFDKLQAMREASPTGGALGQVSTFENELLQSVYGSLAQSQSPEQLRYNLMRLQNTYNNIIYRGYNDDGTLRSENNIGPASYDIPTLDRVGSMNTPEELQGALEFFNYNPPQDVKDAIIQRANMLGL